MNEDIDCNEAIEAEGVTRDQYILQKPVPLYPNKVEYKVQN